MPTFGCDKCKDTKHVLVGDEWVRCECLLEYARNVAYARAGITFDYRLLDYNAGTARKLYPLSVINEYSDKVIKAYIDRVRKGVLPNKVFCFSGSLTSPKDYVIQCIIKASVDVGFKVISKTIDEVIRERFNPEENSPMSDEFNHCDMLVLTFGNELQFKASESFILEYLRVSRINVGKKALVLNTHLSHAGLFEKYSSYDFKDMFVPADAEVLVSKAENRIVTLSL